MISVFADTYYFLALVNRKDEAHAKAVDFGDTFRGEIVSTEWVLTEVGDALSKPSIRPVFLELIKNIQRNPHAVIVEATHDLFKRGLQLFEQRSDKEWSLTDCISFVVMEDQGVKEALTGDHHFEQAGYTALLR